HPASYPLSLHDALPISMIRIQKYKKSPNVFMAAIVWLLLFIGAAMTIVNFHYDVSMQEVQQKLHYLLTGEQNQYPLWIQIPYSLDRKSTRLNSSHVSIS